MTTFRQFEMVKTISKELNKVKYKHNYDDEKEKDWKTKKRGRRRRKNKKFYICLDIKYKIA